MSEDRPIQINDVVEIYSNNELFGLFVITNLSFNKDYIRLSLLDKDLDEDQDDDQDETLILEIFSDETKLLVLLISMMKKY